MFICGLDSSTKYAVHNLNPKTYEEALASTHDKEPELNGRNPKHVTGSHSTSQYGGKGHVDKTQVENCKNGKANGNDKQMHDEKAKAGVLRGFLSKD